jgi:hypothetical protein
MVYLAVFFSSIAAITGILAVGSGEHWKFTAADYLRGKRNAILYLWVTLSTIFSICHAGALLQFGLPNGGRVLWLILHSTMGILLIFAHLFVRTTLSKEVGPVDKYLWGVSHRAAR